MESLKIPSRVTTIGVTIIIAILTYISTMNPMDLANQLGCYGSYAPLIIVIACAIVNQYSEESRVTRAEEIIAKKDNIAKDIIEESNENIKDMDNAIKEIETEDISEPITGEDDDI